MGWGTKSGRVKYAGAIAAHKAKLQAGRDRQAAEIEAETASSSREVEIADVARQIAAVRAERAAIIKRDDLEGRSFSSDQASAGSRLASLEDRMAELAPERRLPTNREKPAATSRGDAQRVLTNAANRSRFPASPNQVSYLASLLSARGLSMDEDLLLGRGLSSRDASQWISDLLRTAP